MKNNLHWEIIRQYRWKSIFVRNLLISFVLTVLPLITITVFLISNYDRETEKHLRAYYENETEKTCTAFDTLTDSLTHSYATLTVGQTVDNYLLMNEETVGTALRVQTIFEIKELLNNTVLYNSAIDSVSVYRASDRYVLSPLASGYLSDYSDTGWLKLYEQNGGRDYICQRAAGGGQKVLTACRSIKGVGGTLRGLIVFNVSQAEVLKRLVNPETKYTSLTIEDASGVIFSSEPPESGKNQASAGELFPVSMTTESNGYHVSITYVTADFNTQKSLVSVLVMVCIVFSILSALVISFTLSRRYYSSVIDVIYTLQGQDYRLAKTDGEFQYVLQNILHLKEQNSELGISLSRAITDLQKSQAAALQEQINPHFIFNALQLISLNDMAEHQRETENTRIISALSNILTYSLDTSHYLVPLETELSYLHSYLEIQNIRYANRISYRENVEESTRGLLCIKFTLQPIVENAVSHGLLENPDQRGEIALTSCVKDGILVITVRDSGPGIPPEKLADLQRQLDSGVLPEKNHIGVLNVQQRIHLICGEQYGISIASDSSGTLVTYRLPVNKAAENRARRKYSEL